MTRHDYKQTAYYLIYLIRCVLHNKIPAKEKLDKMDLSQLYEVAKGHSLTAMAAYALESAGIYDERFTQAKAKAIRKNAMLDIERERLFAEFEKAGIWYMPLKGIILKDYYPRNGMRQMSDNDILFDAGYAEYMRSFMENIGYETVSFGTQQDDIYIKEPIYRFELHRTLVASIFDDFFRYYEDIEDRIIKDSDKQYGYHFSKEDFYIFILCHAYGHYKLGGTGLRTLVDVFIYNRQEIDLDRSYIENELKKLNLIDFEKLCRDVSYKAFGSIRKRKAVQLTDTESAFFDYIIFSGTYGTIENNVKNKYESIQKSKLKYVLDRLILPIDVVKRVFPTFYKYPIILPLLPLYRICKGIKNNRNKVISEIRILLKL